MEETIQLPLRSDEGVKKDQIHRSKLLPALEDCVYTSCYCEENVWKLCDYIRNSHSSDLLSDYFVVFISNPLEQIPLWKQKAGRLEDDHFVVWDYHVILVDKIGQLVFDLDTTLSFPCSLNEYLEHCIGSDSLITKEYRRCFRIIPAKGFLERFASDRSRMKKPDGTWIKPPPSYDSIKTKESDNNLEQFINMTSSAVSEFGQVIVGTDAFGKFFLGS